MGKIKDYFLDQGLTAADLPKALIFHEVISVAFAAFTWTVRVRAEYTHSRVSQWMTQRGHNHWEVGGTFTGLGYVRPIQYVTLSSTTIFVCLVFVLSADEMTRISCLYSFFFFFPHTGLLWYSAQRDFGPPAGETRRRQGGGGIR